MILLILMDPADENLLICGTPLRMFHRGTEVVCSSIIASA
jgi:hypothetical protein